MKSLLQLLQTQVTENISSWSNFSDNIIELFTGWQSGVYQVIMLGQTSVQERNGRSFMLPGIKHISFLEIIFK